MKNLINIILIIAISFSINSVYGQIQNIKLTQEPGLFTTTDLNLSPGQYQFEIKNNGVDHEVGFVLAPKGKTDQENHIKEAYVKAPVKNQSSSLTGVVDLAAGEYVYFCPLNPTEQYHLTVANATTKIQLEQTSGEFIIKQLALSPGDYQFEITNNGVDHEVGFVLAPKGKTDQENHIKEAYVKAPVGNGTSSLTEVVSLQKGHYVYFCPLNPTEQYDLVVE